MFQTSVCEIEYNFVHHAGRVHMDRGCCADMSDCINFFRGIDPDVALIRTIAGIVEDTTYRKLADGRWLASHNGNQFEPAEVPR